MVVPLVVFNSKSYASKARPDFYCLCFERIRWCFTGSLTCSTEIHSCFSCCGNAAPAYNTCTVRQKPAEARRSFSKTPFIRPITYRTNRETFVLASNMIWTDGNRRTEAFKVLTTALSGPQSSLRDTAGSGHPRLCSRCCCRWVLTWMTLPPAHLACGNGCHEFELSLPKAGQQWWMSKN